MKLKNSTKYSSLLILFIILFCSSASAELSIMTTHTEVYKLNSQANLIFHIFNSSNDILNVSKSEVNCTIAIYNESGESKYTGGLLVDNLDYYIKINSSNLGLYSFDIWCNARGGENGWRSDYYYITKEGKNFTPGTSSTTSLITILGVFAVCFLLLYTAFKIDKEKHFILQLIILIFTMVVMILIPKGIMDFTNDYATAGIFYKAVLWFIRVFWVYLFFYLIKEIIVPLKKIRMRFHK